LGQDYVSFELIVSDNASDDATERICRAYALKDPRLKYERSETNLGAVWNFNRVFERARGEYFMWAAFDDLRDPGYVSACAAELATRPDAVLCCSDIRFIDESGEEIAVPAYLRGVHPTGATAGERLRKLARAEHWYDFYGLMRSEALAKTRRAVPTWGFDVVVLLELCLRGPVLVVDRPLFSYRRFQNKTQDDLAASLAAPGQRSSASACWTCLTLQMVRAIGLSPAGAASRALLVGQFLVLFCLLNVPVGASIRGDLGANIREAWAARKLRRLAGLCGLAALIYPVHNRATRGLYRLLRRAFDRAATVTRT
jgi:glycosyltransferase involved in cell wall biosynthesis